MKRNRAPRGKFKLLYYTIVLNLLLWLMVLGAIESEPKAALQIGWCGFVVAAIAQHWGYYRLRNSCETSPGLPLRDFPAS